ncbi:MAG: UDP-N-acetylmuramoyl-tripeptide--D-alanyl-D-alanine ligase [Thermicanus sp.]|nr:UDP-N-acetylmuramoyl-tripeptide--D-alanyl-D-alanine ligase [Thermicanus sp.]
MHKRLEEILHITKGEWVGEKERLTTEITRLSTDTRTLLPGTLFVPLSGERFDGHDFVEEAFAKGAVSSFWKRGKRIPQSLVNAPLILVEDPLTAMQELSSTYRQETGCLIIAITGSNGKTTTKDLITSLLKERYRVHATDGNLNNHIGLPLTLLSMPEKTEIAVVEMGMNHFGELERLSRIARPDMAVITNIGEAHLEYLGTREGIATAKTEILSGMDERGILYYPAEEPLIPATSRFKAFSGKKISCGFTEKGMIQGRVVKDLGLEGTLLEALFNSSQGAGAPSSLKVTIPLPGRHLAQNALYALAIATHLGLTPSEIEKALRSMTHTKMRMQVEKGVNGITLINDAYNASPTSMRAALRFLEELEGYEQKIAILGDMGELGPDAPALHRQIGRELYPGRIDYVFVTGPLAKEYEEGAKEKGYPHVKHFSSREGLIEAVCSLATPTTVVLLKASRFMHFEEIGKAIMREKVE